MVAGGVDFGRRWPTVSSIRMLLMVFPYPGGHTSSVGVVRYNNAHGPSRAHPAVVTLDI